MKHTISIELTEDQINKIFKSRLHEITEPETFSITGAAKKLGIGKTKIHALINAGEISRIMIGKSPRICRSEIDKFLLIPDS